jgi:hypothetical protein
MLGVVMLIIVMLNVDFFIVMLNIIMLRVVLLNVVQNVMAPQYGLHPGRLLTCSLNID